MRRYALTDMPGVAHAWESCARRSDRCVVSAPDASAIGIAHRHRIRSWINIKINDATRRRVPSSVTRARYALRTLCTLSFHPLPFSSGSAQIRPVTVTSRSPVPTARTTIALVWTAQPRPYRMACALAPATLPKDHRAASPRHMAFIIALATCIIHSTQAIPRVTCSW